MSFFFFFFHQTLLSLSSSTPFFSPFFSFSPYLSPSLSFSSPLSPLPPPPLPPPLPFPPSPPPLTPSLLHDSCGDRAPRHVRAERSSALLMAAALHQTAIRASPWELRQPRSLTSKWDLVHPAQSV